MIFHFFDCLHRPPKKYHHKLYIVSFSGLSQPQNVILFKDWINIKRVMIFFTLWQEPAKLMSHLGIIKRIVCQEKVNQLLYDIGALSIELKVLTILYLIEKMT